MKNATITTTLGVFLGILDARANIEIFKIVDTSAVQSQELLRSTKVYTLLGDSEFLGDYGFYKVRGLSVCLGTISILIEEA